MACETPVVMTPTGYADEVVETGLNGYVADYGDVGLWSTYIKALLRDKCMASRSWHSCTRFCSTLLFFGSLCGETLASLPTTLGILRPPLSFENSGPINARSLFPEWQTPPDCLNRSVLPSRIEEVEGSAQQLGYRVDTSVENLSGPGNSSAIYRFKSTGEEYYIKQPIPQENFNRVLSGSE